MPEDVRVQKKRVLGWKDYLAIIIAAFETTLLPILVFLTVLIIILIILK